MEWLNSLLGRNRGVEKGFGNSEYSERVTLDSHKYLSYDECKDIYLHWPLGKRVVTAITNFAMSAPREFSFKDLPHECVDEYKNTLAAFNINEVVRQAANYARIYGLSAVFVSHKTIEPSKPLDYKDLSINDIGFNVLDPLNLAGIEISQNPLSLAYQKVTRLVVNGQVVHPSRVYILFNDIPMYLRWIPSTYSWGSPSVFENMKSLIKSWNRCVIALERMATKAGSIIVKHRDGAVLNSMAVKAAEITLEQIRNMQNDGIASLEKDANIELFNLTGVEVVDSIIEQMNKLIMLALADTPSSVLLDNNLAQGFGEGSEDMKAVLMSTDYFREKTLAPLFRFLDFYCLRICFNDSILQSIKEKNASDITYDIATLKEKVLEGYTAEFGNLYPQKESEKVQNLGAELDTVAKLKEMGANISDIENIVNNKIAPFDTEITFHAPEHDEHEE